ncbi:MAG: hypothetical protein VZT48_09705 [Bulleidia sp.]|nr:hypothetical protein [Bulleidia sp.]
MNTKQRRKIIIAAVIAVICLLITDIANYRKKETLPSLDQIAAMEDVAFLNSVVTDYRRQDLQALWSEPDDSSAMQEIWYIDDNAKLIVNYMNNDDRPVICGIERIG